MIQLILDLIEIYKALFFVLLKEIRVTVAENKVLSPHIFWRFDRRNYRHTNF